MQQHTLLFDIVILWMAALIVAVFLFIGWGTSIHDGGIEQKILGVLPVLVICAAVVVTILQLVGRIGVW